MTGYLFLIQVAAISPTELRVNVGEMVVLDNYFPNCISTRLSARLSEEEGMLKWDKEPQGRFPLSDKESPIATNPGNVKMDLRLFGVIPFKEVTLQVLAPVKVMAGGHSIGVLLNAEGVIAVGYSHFTLENGRKVCPAKEAGLSPETIILNVEGISVDSDVHLSSLVDQYARKQGTIRLRVKYREEIRELEIKPQYCPETRRYRIGLLVADGAAGVGTLTFFDPGTKKYGALGHVITNSGINKSWDFKNSKIVSASIQSIQKGCPGKIGEKVGFFGGKNVSGGINKNTQFGIFGVLDHDLSNNIHSHPLPVAMKHQIKEGPATILTVLENEEIQEFQISIQSILSAPRSQGKSLIIKIEDSRLLNKTGGIVQGMSGSPIIQEGKLVGAVTHVMINDPTRGYGIPAEVMLEEAGLLSNRDQGASMGVYTSVSGDRN